MNYSKKIGKIRKKQKGTYKKTRWYDYDFDYNYIKTISPHTGKYYLPKKFVPTNAKYLKKWNIFRFLTDQTFNIFDISIYMPNNWIFWILKFLDSN